MGYIVLDLGNREIGFLWMIWQRVPICGAVSGLVFGLFICYLLGFFVLLLRLSFPSFALVACVAYLLVSPLSLFYLFSFLCSIYIFLLNIFVCGVDASSC